MGLPPFSCRKELRNTITHNVIDRTKLIIYIDGSKKNKVMQPPFFLKCAKYI